MDSNGYEDFMGFENMQYYIIETWISSARKSNINREVLYVSAAKENRIQDLAFLINDSLCIRRLKVRVGFDYTDLTTINMTKMFNENYIHYLECNTESDVSTPEKFPSNKWDIWEDTVSNWLQTKIGVTNLPLSYVIRKDTAPLATYHSKFIIYNEILINAVFMTDIRNVSNLLTRLVLDTDDFELGGRNFNQNKAREVWIDFVSYYNGSSDYERHIFATRYNLSNLLYNN